MEHTVNVTFQPGPPASLTVDPMNVDLRAGDQVVWKFDDLPAGCTGGIHFETPLGPFHSLRLLRSDLFLGKGNVGLQGVPPMTYPYRAQVVDIDEFHVASTAPLPTITNLSPDQNTSPEVVVQCTREGSELLLDVDPLKVSLSTGDTATWHIFGLPADHSVTLFYPDLVNPADPLLGPFQGVLWNRAVAGDDPNEIRGNAIGFGLAEGVELTRGQEIRYRVQVRAAQGNVVASKDPVIDNLGEPADPPSLV